MWKINFLSLPLNAENAGLEFAGPRMQTRKSAYYTRKLLYNRQSSRRGKQGVYLSSSCSHKVSFYTRCDRCVHRSRRRAPPEECRYQYIDRPVVSARLVDRCMSAHIEIHRTDLRPATRCHIISGLLWVWKFSWGFPWLWAQDGYGDCNLPHGPMGIL